MSLTIHSRIKSPAIRQTLGFCLLFSATSLMGQAPPAPANPTLTVFRALNASGNTQTVIIEVSGQNLTSPDVPRVVVYPAGGTSEVTVLGTPSPTAIRAEFTAPTDYALGGILLSHNTGAPVSLPAQTACNPDTDIMASYSIVPQDQVKDKYGNGVAKKFDVFQVSMVNHCTVQVVVPLAGIRILAPGTASQKAGNYLVPFSLDHVTSVYSTDRKLTGKRAMFFNALQALATLGSAVEPFFGHGFTQGVAIWGGGFTQAMQTVMKDMSAEQLQNLASQSFASTEQIGPNGGSLQKFLFVQKYRPAGARKATSLLDVAKSGGEIHVTFSAIPTVASAGTTTATQVK